MDQKSLKSKQSLRHIDVDVVPECRRHSLCTPHTVCNAEGWEVGGVHLPVGLCKAAGWPQSAENTSSWWDTSRRTDRTDRPSKSGILNTNWSGMVRGTGRRSPKQCWEWRKQFMRLKKYWKSSSCTVWLNTLTLPPGRAVRFQVSAISLVCPDAELFRYPSAWIRYQFPLVRFWNIREPSGRESIRMSFSSWADHRPSTSVCIKEIHLQHTHNQAVTCIDSIFP